ncbi:hypothetical protein BDK51DRAFT_40513 [Blyttiomyces helicus]|uniref:Uncharacterized protein n=1 Tax=Blyttiomyces helicus TaxID=388810 RepID=A0A4P9W8X6_9FUNG|nr:hypothetical protein BDK51DRAFT_40513 [Blyttiomyces helicus]|eukprot:RKO88991.1 hypothetical protein BDK51DRAFT_40513 [Blyttiomyces helicus]
MPRGRALHSQASEHVIEPAIRTCLVPGPLALPRASATCSCESLKNACESLDAPSPSSETVATSAAPWDSSTQIETRDAPIHAIAGLPPTREILSRPSHPVAFTSAAQPSFPSTTSSSDGNIAPQTMLGMVETPQPQPQPHPHSPQRHFSAAAMTVFDLTAIAPFVGRSASNPSTSTNPLPIALTIVGQIGAGKSTLANHLVLPDYIPGHTPDVFPVGHGASSATELITGMNSDLGNFMVYDTPGLGNTDRLEMEYFSALTEHLHQHGGIVIFVCRDNRIDTRLRNHFLALHLSIFDSLATSVVFVRANVEWNMFLSDENNVVNIEDELDRAEVELAELAAPRFAGRFGYTHAKRETAVALKSYLLEKIHSTHGIRPQSVRTWKTTCARAESHVASELQKLEWLRVDVDGCRATIANLERKL